ncbi:MAG TPA: hypothetical protein VF618_07095 [Thermoanaerobaculia bacterium]
MTVIKTAVDVQVSDGPRINFKNQLEVDAYDRIDVSVPSDNTPVNAEVQPGSTVTFLLIRSSVSNDLVTLKNGTAQISLASPIVLAGGGVGLLAAPAKTLTFTNDSGTDAKITVLVGRDATPPPQPPQPPPPPPPPQDGEEDNP